MSAASASSCYFIFILFFFYAVKRAAPPPRPPLSRPKATHERSACGFPRARSPFEMATHELQCVVVGRRHAEHQTLQPIHFVHVVRHLCRGDSDTCHISAEARSARIYFTCENLIDIHQVSSHEPISNLI